MTTSTDSIDVKQAVLNAMNFVKDLYEGQKTENLLLEEVEFSDNQNQWLVTIGFSIPKQDDSVTAALMLRPSHSTERYYKVIHIDAESGKALSMKMREI